MGRPTKYKPEYCELATKFCMLGATDIKLGEFFDVSEVTINAWKNEHPAFLKSLKAGKEIADANVADALYHRALGYSHPEVHVSNFQGEITLTPITKHYPPDTGAAMAWLKNRQRGLWRDDKDLNVNIKHHASVQKSRDWAAGIAGEVIYLSSEESISH